MTRFLIALSLALTLVACSSNSKGTSEAKPQPVAEEAVCTCSDNDGMCVACDGAPEGS